MRLFRVSYNNKRGEKSPLLLLYAQVGLIKKITLSIIFCFLLCFLNSCIETIDIKNKNIIPYTNIENVDSIILKGITIDNIDKISFNLFDSTHLVVCHLNNEYYKIEKYSLDSSSVVMGDIIYKEKGRINRIRDFILFKDSLIFLDKNFQLTKLNFNDSVLTTNYINIDKYSFCSDQFIEQRLILDNNNIFIKLSPKDIENNNKPYNTHLIGEYSLNQQKLILTFGNWPKKQIDLFNENKYFPVFSEPSFVIDNKKCYISFGFDPFVYTYTNYSNNVYEKKIIKSAFINESNNGVDFDADYQEVANYLITTGFYLKLLKDPYKNLYYRIVKHPQNLKNENGLLNGRFDGSWSIIVLDSVLNTKYEILMPKNRYNYLFSFVSKRGLFIQVADDRNLKFEILNLN
ncbi:MAG: hypothetical protein HUU48_06405 [Flavobacteriales bacterium]|nr:hypothetical protein [Flavobacteriales bacterium]